MELPKPIDVAPKNGDFIKFLQRTGHRPPMTLPVRPIVNICCFLLVLSQTTKQNNHRSGPSLL